MDNKVVLDASALLALINQEKGSAIVEKYLSKAIMSSVNIAEVATVLIDVGMPITEIESLIHSIVPYHINFDAYQAFVSAQLREKTKAYGLSFGDRACLSLAKIKKIPVLTADKVWIKLNLNIKIEFIR